jgi:hypothetical protein
MKEDMGIWSSINKFVHDEEVYQPLGSMELIEEQMALLELPPARAKVQKREYRWAKPLAGWCMINTDGSINAATREAALVEKRPLVPVCKAHWSWLEQPGLTKRD